MQHVLIDVALQTCEHHMCYCSAVQYTNCMLLCRTAIFKNTMTDQLVALASALLCCHALTAAKLLCRHLRSQQASPLERPAKGISITAAAGRALNAVPTQPTAIKQRQGLQMLIIRRLLLR